MQTTSAKSSGGNGKRGVLKEQILEDIKGGIYRPGQLLPPENDLARRVGLARGTVRQALNELVAEGILRRIKGRGTVVKRDCNAEPGQRAKLNAFGLIMPEIAGDLYPSLIDGFYQVARDSNHLAMVCNTGGDVQTQGNIILQLIDQNIAGLAMVPVMAPTPVYQVRQLQVNAIPYVILHRRVQGAQAPFVGWDAYEVGRLAGEAFVERGHRDIAFMGGYHEKYPLYEAYEKGLRDTLERHGLSLPAERVFKRSMFNYRIEDPVEELRPLVRALKDEQRPTAVLCTGSVFPENLYRLVRELGIKVPEELSIIGFACKTLQESFGRKAAYVVVDECQIGKHTARLLSEMQLGQRALNDTEEILVPLKLRHGQGLAVAAKLV